MLSDSSAGQALLKSRGISTSPPQRVQVVSDEIPQKQQPKSQSKQETKTKKSDKKKSTAQKNFTFVLKVFNVTLGLLLITFGSYSYYDMNNRDVKNFQLIGYIMPGYIALSGLIILAIEIHIGIICRNMKFLYNYFGRGFFNIYVGVMPLTLLDNTQGSKQSELEQVGIYILVSALLFIGCLYIFAKIFCCAKQDDKKKRRKRKSQVLSSDSDQ